MDIIDLRPNTKKPLRGVTDILEIKLPHIAPTVEETFQHRGFLVVLKDNSVGTFELDYGYAYSDDETFEKYDSKEDFDKQTNALECYYEITKSKTGQEIIKAFPNELLEIWVCDI